MGEVIHTPQFSAGPHTNIRSALDRYILLSILMLMPKVRKFKNHLFWVCLYLYFFLHIDKKNHLHSTYIFFSSNSRSSITRLSVDDKAQRSKEESERERNLLLHKTIEERKAELEVIISYCKILMKNFVKLQNGIFK